MRQFLRTLFGAEPAARPVAPRLGLTALEAREVPAVIGTLYPENGQNVLRLSGDLAADTVTISHNGAGKIVLSGTANLDGELPGTVVRIEGDLSGGNDRVTFNQGSTTAGVSQTRSLTVDLELGGGADRFTANLHGGITSGDKLTLKVNGGGFSAWDDGADNITVNAGVLNGGDDFDIATGGVLDVRVYGGLGNDTLRLNYDGDLDGDILLDMRGGDGDDALTVRAEPDAGSRGLLQGGDDVFGNPTQARVRGDAGSDAITFHFDKDVPADGVKAIVLLDGGWSPFDDDTVDVFGNRSGSVISLANIERSV